MDRLKNGETLINHGYIKKSEDFFEFSLTKLTN